MKKIENQMKIEICKMEPEEAAVTFGEQNMMRCQKSSFMSTKRKR